MTTSERNTPSPINHAMRCGLEMGVWFAVNFILSAQQDMHPSLSIVAWLVQVYIVYGVYRLTHHYKHFECNDTLTFGQAYRYILWLFMFSSLVASLVRFVYMQWIDTTYLSRLFAMLEEQMPMLSADGNAESLLKSVRLMLTPIRFAVYSIVSDLIWGALLGLIMAPFISRFNRKFLDKNQFNNQ